MEQHPLDSRAIFFKELTRDVLNAKNDKINASNQTHQRGHVRNKDSPMSMDTDITDQLPDKALMVVEIIIY